MLLNDIKYRLKEWIKINQNFFFKAKANYKYQKRKNIIYNNELINSIKNTYKPVFVLSTGRCGTEYLTKVLELSEQTEVYHSPHPELILASKFAYENYIYKHEILQQIVESARIELILNSYLRNKVFVETNNKITFFAFALAELFPKSKFIHLIRNPSNFVVSGLNRNWYKELSNHDLGRIVPKDNKLEFGKLNDIQKISWLWNETNLFIEDFKLNLNNPSRVITIKAENLFGKIETINSIYEFIGCEYPNEGNIKSVLLKKVNAQKNLQTLKYEDWNKADKEFLKNNCTLAENYGYRLT